MRTTTLSRLVPLVLLVLAVPAGYAIAQSGSGESGANADAPTSAEDIDPRDPPSAPVPVSDLVGSNLDYAFEGDQPSWARECREDETTLRDPLACEAIIAINDGTLSPGGYSKQQLEAALARIRDQSQSAAAAHQSAEIPSPADVPTVGVKALEQQESGWYNLTDDENPEEPVPDQLVYWMTKGSEADVPAAVRKLRAWEGIVSSVLPNTPDLIGLSIASDGHSVSALVKEPHAFSVEGLSAQPGNSAEDVRYWNETRRYGLTQIRKGILRNADQTDEAWFDSAYVAESERQLKEIDDELSQIGGTLNKLDESLSLDGER